LRSVLSHQVNLTDSGVKAVREDEIDDAELSAERCGRFATVRCQIAQAFATTTGHDDG
jgi:hypothetical protein